MDKFNHKKIDKKWQKYWEKEGIFKTGEEKGKKKFYCLDMFPYPSGAGLHVGHPEGYTATDIMCRYRHMKYDENILHPMGFDAFGLPTENYAIKVGKKPKDITEENIKKFTKQLKSFGFSYDWDRQVITSDPKYYKWTQWMFREFYKKGLAYKKEAPVNWCEDCKTVLAREQVVDGKCERCKNEVIQKNLFQWFFKITDYVEELLSDIENLDWPESIKSLQRNWIGRSVGAEVEFKVKTEDVYVEAGSFASGEAQDKLHLKVFTTRPDTLFGATFMVVAPEHELIANNESRITNYKEVEKYIKQAQKKSEMERTDLNKDKSGVELKGLKAINPVNNEEIPIFIADYVMLGYGTGAIMAVPAHDSRDYLFAQKYKLPVVEVVKSVDKSSQLSALSSQPLANCFEGEGVAINSGKFDGLSTAEFKEKIIKWLEKEKLGKRAINYKLRDWLISRQRYWGCPIPIIYCEECAKKKEQVLILHGWEDSSQSTFIPGLKKNLEAKGYNVFAFDAPNTDEPDFDKWFSFIEQKIKENNLKDFHLVGHSMGGHLACKLAEKYKLASLKLVAPVGFSPTEKYFEQYKNSLTQEEIIFFRNYQKRELDTKKVKKNVKEISFIFGINDPWITKEIREFYINNFKDIASIKILDNAAHWGNEEGIKNLNYLEDLFKQVNLSEMLDEEFVELPDDVDFRPTGESPLVNSKKFHNIKCPKCGATKGVRREVDTMDTFVCSSWYFLRYCDNKNKQAPFDKEKVEAMMPVDLYVGGAEHAVMHLMYARFFTKALADMGYLNFREPFTKLRNQGHILAEDGKKMSKSLGNVINPDEAVEKYGADTFRMYEMFMGPLEDSKPWNTSSIAGVRRFLERVWKLESQIMNNELRITNNNLEKLLHQTIKKVTEDIEDMKFNTAISAMMILVNEMEKSEQLTTNSYQLLLLLLSPFAPHMVEELWEKLGHKKSIIFEEWPEYDKNLIKEDEVEIVVQINGKVRDKVKLPVEVTEAEVKTKILELENVKKWLDGKKPKKIIYIKGKLMSIVV